MRRQLGAYVSLNGFSLLTAARDVAPLLAAQHVSALPRNRWSVTSSLEFVVTRRDEPAAVLLWDSPSVLIHDAGLDIVLRGYFGGVEAGVCNFAADPEVRQGKRKNSRCARMARTNYSEARMRRALL